VDTWRLGIGKLAAGYRAGKLGPMRVIEECLDRITRLDARLGAFTYVDQEGAHEQAAESARRLATGEERSLLEGVPVGVKEIFDVEGWPSTGASLVYADRVASADSGLVTLLRRAGAVIVGLTRSHEFAMGVTSQHETRGSTANPWDLQRIPGGSSGGSAAAVAAGLVPLAVASDTSGSARIPAAFCGITGIRPSLGLLPLDGALPLAPSYDSAGFVARRVDDLVITLEASAGLRPDYRPSLDGLRVGVPAEPLLALGEAQSSAFEAAIEAARELDAAVEPVPLPTSDELGEALQLQIAEIVEVHRDQLRTWPGHSERMGDSVRVRLEGMIQRGADAELGRQANARIRQRVTALGFDLFLAPVATQGPPPMSDPERGDYRDTTLRSNHLQAVLAAPAVAVPAGLDDDGLPMGVQVWSHSGHDAEALGAARLLQERLSPRLPEWPSLVEP
jgi:aspartyl-tRNA(Asn)/glutamyl-tRNA(Gln) amidotransferase subunit A